MCTVYLRMMYSIRYEEIYLYEVSFVGGLYSGDNFI